MDFAEHRPGVTDDQIRVIGQEQDVPVLGPVDVHALPYPNAIIADVGDCGFVVARDAHGVKLTERKRSGNLPGVKSLAANSDGHACGDRLNKLSFIEQIDFHS